MGVPALFRWLSKKYPKIVLPVVEEEETRIPGEDDKLVAIPVDISKPNPNGQEFDNLYLDMNGIVHPCTHPEGKPAPETEEDMMIEVFSYTERVVNMVRPRKLLLMAIDGVAPRAKMNQQRSRRFRSAQEAKEKEEARKESIAIWESMGQTVTDEERNKTAWDSNAITPGTPFMDLLAQSLRYWVVQKANTDPGWANLEVIISDASVPGEGEHKIMDFIRRQRTNPGYNPNTQHVIYGLDADLIMLSLATHEPHFRVLREDVFFNDTSPSACRLCGQEGHYAAQCTGQKKEKADDKPIAKKPFIFLDVSILREYLDAELSISSTPFPFNLERAIDDWVLLIFFVGNDFLPHLPSLEIREGAIDTLLKIWKNELARMGGYVTDHGRLNFARLEVILDGLAGREDEIFRRRKEAEDRQDQNAKRRKLEAANGGTSYVEVKASASLQLTANPTAPSNPPVSAPAPPIRHALPPRPNFDSFETSATTLGLGSVAPTVNPVGNQAAAMSGITGTAHDWVTNRRAIRMANMSAAEMLKAEMMSASPVASKSVHSAGASASPPPTISPAREATPATPINNAAPQAGNAISNDENPIATAEVSRTIVGSVSSASVEPESPQGTKRKHDDLDKDAEGDVVDDTFEIEPEEDDDAPGDVAVAVVQRKVNSDGTVEQEDTVKLWEPGYKERYYRQKFGVELSDTEFRQKLTTCYVEGLAWVLHYYYQGTPSWVWYYPYHFAPFAADFKDVAKMDIKFTPGQPFKPFEQLMGVFPPASRKHIPEVFQDLMINEESPILDFYPETFEIDMNGKKMAWQGVALLPFIDEKRLLDAMATKYPSLTEDEVRRNKWGSNVLYVAESHPLYASVESLYTKRKKKEPTPIDPSVNEGHSGSLLADPTCIPGSTYYCPIPSTGLPDIPADRSLSALYYFPKQMRPHRSELLPGARRPPRILSNEDMENVRRGGRGRGRGRDNGYGGPGRGGHNSWENGGARNYGGGNASYGTNSYDRDRGGYGGGGRGSGDRGRSSYGGPPPRSYQPPPVGGYGRGPNQHQGGYGRDYTGGGQGGQHQSYNSGYSVPGGGGGGGYGGYGGYGGGGGVGSGGYGGYGGAGGQGAGGSAGNNRGGGYGGYGQHQSSYNTPARGRGRGGYDRY